MASAIFGFWGPAFAQSMTCPGDPGNMPVYIQDDPCPLTSLHNKAFFSETNFAPGDSKTSRAVIKNKSGQAQKVTLKAFAFANPIAARDLARVLEIVISQDSGNGKRTAIFGGFNTKKTLLQFFEAGEIHLPDIAPGKSARYYLAVSFPGRFGNDWQERATDFSVMIGFPDSNNRGVAVRACLPGDKKQEKIGWPATILRWLSSFGIFSRQAIAFHGN